MNKLLLSITLGVIASFFATVTCLSQDAETYMLQAEQKSLEKKYKDAINLSSKAIKLYPGNPDYYLARSNYYISANDIQLGFEDLNTAIKVAPKNADGYIRRAFFYFQIGEPEKSTLDYTVALEYITSDSIKSYILMNRASAKRQRRDFEGAIADCEEALKIDSMNVGAVNNMAMSLDEVGRDDETLFYLKKAIRIDSTQAYLHMNVGFWLSCHQRYQEALGYFNKSLSIDSEQAITYNNRGYAKLMLNDFNGALEDINRSIKMLPGNSYAYRNRGLVYFYQKKNTKACEEWNIALRYNFTKEYGTEVEELLKKNCFK